MGWSGSAMVLDKLPVPGRPIPTFWASIYSCQNENGGNIEIILKIIAIIFPGNLQLSR